LMVRARESSLALERVLPPRAPNAGHVGRGGGSVACPEVGVRNHVLERKI